MNNINNNEVISGLFLSSSENIIAAEEITRSPYLDTTNTTNTTTNGTAAPVVTHPYTRDHRGDSGEDAELNRPSRSKFVSLEISDTSYSERNTNIKPESIVPNMWTKDYIGLYCQYAAVGLLYGSGGTVIPFCAYTFNGSSNVCANSKNIVFFAWSFKIFFAILVDSYRPFGLRRKPWMIAGWSMVLLLLLILACAADQMSVSIWLVTLLLVQGFLMLSDVPGDGYSVELGHLEPFEQRGQILATGQRIRFSFCVLAGIIQALFLNGPTTNDSDCEISPSQCWEFGVTINQYYALLFVIIFFLTLPILWLKELDATNIPQHTVQHFLADIWDTLQNLTTFYLLIFVIGVHGLTNFTNNANISIQYYVIKLTNLQVGIDTATTYAALASAIYLFQRYLINKNWRYTQYGSTIGSAILGLVWIAVYYNEGGTMDGWFTIFIDLDTYFVQGLTQVLYSMAVIELAKPGQEATTYELVVTVGNAALIANGIVSTQLLTPLNSVGCDDDYGDCPSTSVVVTSPSSFNDSDGPVRFTNYTLVLTGIMITATFIFTPFLPSGKEECHEWRKLGEARGNSKKRGYMTLALAIITILYGLVAAILLLDAQTSCSPAVGGSGC